MDFVWPFIILLSLVCSGIGGNIAETLSSGISGAASAIDVLLSFAGIMCFWSGILRIAEKGGAAEKCERLLSPVIRRLFPKTHCLKSISINIIANLFGTGNAATPAGISAMHGMDKENGEKPMPSREMSRFTVMNTASLQIFPTTVISILTSFGATNPFSIVPCIWISSFAALSVALLAEILFCGGSDNK